MVSQHSICHVEASTDTACLKKYPLPSASHNCNEQVPRNTVAHNGSSYEWSPRCSCINGSSDSSAAQHLSQLLSATGSFLLPHRYVVHQTEYTSPAQPQVSKVKHRCICLVEALYTAASKMYSPPSDRPPPPECPSPIHFKQPAGNRDRRSIDRSSFRKSRQHPESSATVCTFDYDTSKSQQSLRDFVMTVEMSVMSALSDMSNCITLPSKIRKRPKGRQLQLAILGYLYVICIQQCDGRF